jgi:hypothetical protein
MVQCGSPFGRVAAVLKYLDKLQLLNFRQSAAFTVAREGLRTPRERAVGRVGQVICVRELVIDQ